MHLTTNADLTRLTLQVKKLEDQLAVKEKRVDELMKVEAYTKQEKITVAKQRKQAKNNEVRAPYIHISAILRHCLSGCNGQTQRVRGRSKCLK